MKYSYEHEYEYEYGYMYMYGCMHTNHSRTIMQLASIYTWPMKPSDIGLQTR